ncbi:MAG TPA: hypothetical protein VNZ66_04245 [Aeromicrobium sp.]|nr:hypothetical protein [Aeromicrobium sp.]
MPADVAILVVTALVAAVAVAAAVVAVRALREVRRINAERAAEPPRELVVTEPEPSVVDVDARPVKVVEGRVVATLTQQDLLEARLSRPLARLSVYAHGIAHALRPESRDRITALMKREYRRRRAIRLRAARRALYAVPNDELTGRTEWLGSTDRAESLPRAVGE